jgi:N utilization substance protein A
LDDFGRRSVLNARQALMSRIIELEKDELFRKYKDKRGEIITGEVYNVWKREIMILDDEGNELILPKIEMIQADHYKKGDAIRAVVLKVEMHNGTPRIILSRTSPVFLERLFEQEVPELYEGNIEVKAVVRDAGSRAKIAIYSRRDDIDIIGSFIGIRGSRVQSVSSELRGEKIDIIDFSEDPATYVANALAPARVTSVEIVDLEAKSAKVIVPDYQLSLAIGKDGQNARLAARLTQWRIDIHPDNPVTQIKAEKPEEVATISPIEGD